MSSNELEEYRKIQKRKYEQFLEKKKYNNNLEKLIKLNFTKEQCKLIFDNNYIIKIQRFFRKYRLCNKLCYNLQDIIDYDNDDIIRFRHGYKIYGFHYLDIIKHFDEIGYSNPITNIPLELYHLRRINSLIKKINKYLFTKHSKYYDFQGINFNLSDCWNSNEIYNLFEARGINSVKVPENIFNTMVDLKPSIYAIEIISENNARRSYATFDSFPSQDIVQLPIGIYQQLKVFPKYVSKFKMRIIEPLKGTKIGIRCMINKKKLLKDIKGKLTLEINKHKILSLNQIIIVESDINYGMIPFRIDVLEPSNVITITDTDIEVDFLESLHYDNSMEALLIELNK